MVVRNCTTSTTNGARMDIRRLGSWQGRMKLYILGIDLRVGTAFSTGREGKFHAGWRSDDRINEYLIFLQYIALLAFV